MLGAGVLAVLVGLMVGWWLAAEPASPGAIGFPLLLSLPGQWLLLRGAGIPPGRALGAGLATGMGLLGLDVVDSARTEVRAGGWVTAAVGTAAVLALAARSRPAGLQDPRGEVAGHRP